MNNRTIPIVVTLLLPLLINSIGFSQERKDLKYKDQPGYRPTKPNMPNYQSHNRIFIWENNIPMKYTPKFRLAEKDDILGEWQFIDTPDYTIKFDSDSLKQTFKFFDSASEVGSSGEWRESYMNDILIVTLVHYDIDITEQLAVQVLDRKMLALGTIVKGEFSYRYRIKKQ